MTAVGSAAEDTTPSEREAPQRFAWWHPRSVDLGRHQAPQLGLKIVLGYRSVRGKRNQDRDWKVAPAYSNAVSTKLALRVW